MAERIIEPRLSRWEKMKNQIKGFSPQVKQGIIAAVVTLFVGLLGFIGTIIGLIFVSIDNSRLKSQVHDLETEVLPFRNLAVQEFNKADSASMKKLAETMTTLRKDYAANLEILNSNRVEIEQLWKEKRIIRSIVLELIISPETPPRGLSGETHSLGSDLCIALFTESWTRIRFKCPTEDIWESQPTPTEQRVDFRNFLPETADDILGKDISYLATVRFLGFKLDDFCKERHVEIKGTSAVTFKVRVNGLEVLLVSFPASRDKLVGGERFLNLSRWFSDSPQKYDAGLARLSAPK